MRQRKPARARLLSVFATGFGISITPFAGCDRSTSVSEIPEASRKALIQRKVDVKPGQAKSSRTGGTATKGRSSPR